MSCATSRQLHHHGQVASILHQEVAVRGGLSNGPQVPYYKYEPQSVVQNFSYKLYYDRSITADLTIHNDRQDIVMIDKIIREAC